MNPAKPTNLKHLHGTFRDDRAVRNEPRPRADRIKAPVWLSKAAKKEFKRVAVELQEVGLLTNIDVMALVLYCQLFDDLQTVTKRVEQEGMFYINAGLVKTHPGVRVKDMIIKSMLAIMREFGMTPSSRSRVNAKPEADSDEQQFLDFMYGA